jgi:class 3 adenylate cyclase
VPDVPETRYAKTADGADIAYQVVGDGPIDVLVGGGLNVHVEQRWEFPPEERFLQRIASFARLILFDRRGTGASDPMPSDRPLTWEQWADDVAVVLDAAGSTKAAFVAAYEECAIALLFAATHPERTAALVLWQASARYVSAEDYPVGLPPDVVEAMVDGVEAHWGTEQGMLDANPSLAGNTAYLRQLARLARSSVTPRAAARHMRYSLRLDVRQVLGSVRAPTLVLHRAMAPFSAIDQGRYVAEHLQNARFVTVPGRDMLPDTERSDEILDHIEEFLTGGHRYLEADRVLSTVLFTDIVGSTAKASTLGDRAWRDLLDAHDAVVRRQLERFRGHEVNTTGDGFLASFDGPTRGIQCATAIRDSVRHLGIELRAGLHTGECEVRGRDLGGLAVHLAARVGAVAGSGEVLVSSTVRDLVAGSGIEFDDRGVHELKGVPGTWHLYAVND